MPTGPTRHLQMLMQYSAWADALLYESLTSMAPALLHQARPGRPAGVVGVLGHIYTVDRIWKAHLEGREHGLTSRQLESNMPLDALRRSQLEMDAWYVSHALAQDDAMLSRVIDFRFVDGRPGSMRRDDMLLHIAHHKTYHRGYVADMLYESGLKPPTMDLPVYLRDVHRGP